MQPPEVNPATLMPQATTVLGTRVSRRNFMQSMGISAAAATLSAQAAETLRSPVSAGAAAAKNAAIGPEPVPLTLIVNETQHKVTVEPSTTLLEVLRHHLGLTGSKEVCDRGSCGACSVMIDGTLVVSCMTLAAEAVDRRITTIEGLAKQGKLDIVQEMFIKHDALQCGFCTPGLVVASRWLLNNNPSPTLDEIKEGLAGNICRCGTYTNIFNAVLEASGQHPVMDSGTTT